MSRKHLQELIKNLQEFYKCPSCDVSYHFDDIKFLGQIDHLCFVQMTCHSCSMPMLATLSVEQPIRRRKSDLKKAEASRFEKQGEITSDEIADFHRFISAHKGGLEKLIK